MKLRELKAIVNSINEDDDNIDIVIFVDTDHAYKSIVVDFKEIRVTDCQAELIPSQPIRLL